MDFSFLHAADLHLGSPFVGIGKSNPKLQEHLQNAYFKSFRKLVDLAISRTVDLVLLSGDIFDDDRPSLQTQKIFRDGLNRLTAKGIPVVIILGNHDADLLDNLYFALPEKVHILGTDQVDHLAMQVAGGTIDIFGLSFKPGQQARELKGIFKRGQPNNFAIGMLHCEIGNTSGTYAPVTIKQLSDCDIDYWALGHVHSPKVLSENPYIVYSGTIQGSNKNELGSKGCFLVSVKDQFVNLEFNDLHSVLWTNVDLDISNFDKSELVDSLFDLKNRLRSSEQGIMLKVNLTGFSQLNSWLLEKDEMEDIISELRREEEKEDFVWITEVGIKTKPAELYTELFNSKDFLGDVLRLLEVAKLDKDNQMDLIKVFEEVAAGIEDELDLNEIFEQAAFKAIELLGGGD